MSRNVKLQAWDFKLSQFNLLKIKKLSSSSLKYLTFKKLRIIKNVIVGQTRGGQTRVVKNKSS